MKSGTILNKFILIILCLLSYCSMLKTKVKSTAQTLYEPNEIIRDYSHIAESLVSDSIFNL